MSTTNQSSALAPSTLAASSLSAELSPNSKRTPGNTPCAVAPQGSGIVVPPRVHGPNPSKWYVMSGGQAIEVTDRLIAYLICPSDLNGHPCIFDELPEGCEGYCEKLKLCEMQVKFRGYQCPGKLYCKFVHDIEMSCRYVANCHHNPNRVCVQTLWKNRWCSGGHDFEVARQMAKDAHFKHERNGVNMGLEYSFQFYKQW